MKQATLVLAAALVASTALAGCFGKDDAPASIEDDTGGVTFSNQTIDKIATFAAAKPSRFAFPVAAPPAVDTLTTWSNGTVGPDANSGVEFPQDRGGTSYNTLTIADDFSSFVPVGQPTLINVRLWYDNKPGASVDLDIFVEGHAVRDHVAKEFHGEYAWTLPVKTKSAVTMGDGTTRIGVQAANGRILPGNSVEYWMRIEFIYGEDVAAPKVPYALDVPANASGLIVESVKFAGDTHVQGEFLVVGPDNDLVAAVEFDDIAIPTQSIYIPISKPGTHVFYVINVKNGFFAVRADAPLDDHVARALKPVFTEQVLITESVSPGVAKHHAQGEETPFTGGTVVDFAVDGNFPLEMRPFIEGEGATGDVHLVVTSPKGNVAEYHRFARYDNAQGSVGVSDESTRQNNLFRPTLLALGSHQLSAVVNGMQGQAGVRIVTYDL